MAAYAAVISLKHTINSLRHSPISSTLENLESAYDGATSLQQVLERLNDSKRLDSFEGQIRDAANKLEDVFEEYESNKLYSQEENEQVREEMSSFAEILKKVEKDYSEEVCRDGDDDDDDAAVVSSHIDFGVEMVGHSDTFNTIRECLLQKMRPNDRYFLASIGEIGSGRTAVVKTIYEDLHECGEQHYDCYAWVTLGTAHEQFKEVAKRILAQVKGDQVAAGDDHELLLSADDEKISNYLYKLWSSEGT